METEPFIDYSSPVKKPARKVFSVSQLNQGIRNILEMQYSGIWMEGEISNFKRHTSGHCYLSLKDEKAQMSAVFFNHYSRNVRFELKDGLKVLVFGKISVYEPRGQYQFYIERIEPKGIGDLQLAFMQLREKLEKEGLFDPERKKEIPQFPKRVGIVTSPTGAAIRDILNVMTRRFCGTEILIYPVLVQGEGAAAQIERAIDDFNKMKCVDVMIVGRGGGSMEDLWAFNEERVARAIFRSVIPVISAVGHEIDWTIADFVADMRAPTPSAAAELVVQNRVDLEKRLRELRYRMVNSVRMLAEDRRRALQDLQESYAFKQPQVLIQQFSQRMDEMLRQMQNYMKTGIKHRSQELGTLAGRLSALSPLAILERGYSISFDETGELLKDAAKVKKGQTIKTRLKKGTLFSQVTKIE